MWTISKSNLVSETIFFNDAKKNWKTTVDSHYSLGGKFSAIGLCHEAKIYLKQV